VAWDQIPLSLLDLLHSGAGLAGTLAGNLQLSGSRIDPSGKLSLNIADLQQNSPAGRKLPKLNGSMRSDWKGGRLQLRGNVTGIGEAGLKLDADVPLRFADDSLTPLLPSTESLSARASWHGPIEPLVRLIDFDEHELSGTADLDVELVGTLDSPKAKGTVKLEQGVYEHHGVGTLLKNMSITVEGNDDRLTAKGTATDGSSGRVRAAGFVELASAAQPLIGLELEMDKVTLIRLEGVRATASGKLAVTGTLTEARLEGELVTDQVEARIIDNSVPQVTELEVTEINHAQGKPTTDDKPEAAAPMTLTMDLDLRMPGKVFVRGGGLDSEWAGQLEVTGTADSPIVSGELRPVRGGFTLAGKRFTLRSGSVRFDGSGAVDPLLDLPLEHNGANITAIISITGQASAPQMKMSSRPPLPESEILSRVLFGAGAQQLTTAQKIELAGAVASLSGSGAGALDKARDRLGVDVLSVNEGTDSSTTKLKAGKYVTDRVYVEMEKGAQKNTGTATVEVEIAPRVRVQTGSKGQGEGKVGIEWRWDY
jgi:translocation and assembly module TamB